VHLQHRLGPVQPDGGVPPLPGMGPCLPSSIQGFVLDGASVYRMTVSTIHNIAL